LDCELWFCGLCHILCTFGQMSCLSCVDEVPIGCYEVLLVYCSIEFLYFRSSTVTVILLNSNLCCLSHLVGGMNKILFLLIKLIFVEIGAL